MYLSSLMKNYIAWRKQKLDAGRPELDDEGAAHLSAIRQEIDSLLENVSVQRYCVVIHDRQYDSDPNNNVWLMCVEGEGLDSPAKAQLLMRKAVAAFLATADGQAILDMNDGSFNWGDARVHVPDTYFARFGLRIIDGPDLASIVDHDELLEQISL